MPFVVEDGTGLENSNSFVSVAFANDYFALRTNAVWAALDNAAKERALILATDFLTDQYQQLWIGNVVSNLQALPWPRAAGVWDVAIVSGVPENLRRATVELALLAAQGDLYAPTVSAQPASAALTEKQTQIGPLTKIEKYSTSAGAGSVPSVPTLVVMRDRVSALLLPLLQQSARWETVRA